MISECQEIYSLAKEIARIILTQSYQTGSGSTFCGVHDVLLFGSVLREQKGHDIDMLILHSIPGLHEFYSHTYTHIPTSSIPIFYSDRPVRKAGNMRTSTYHILRDLACREHDEHRAMDNGIDEPELEELLLVRPIREFVVSQGWTILEPRELLPYELDEETLRQLWKLDGREREPPKNQMRYAVLRRGEEVLYQGDWWPFGDQMEELWHNMHVYYQVQKLLRNPDSDSLNTALDLHLMRVRALQSKSKRWHRKREIAMLRCKDPAFWFTILSQGRLYDSETKDFTKSVSEKYPSALDFFAVK